MMRELLALMGWNSSLSGRATIYDEQSGSENSITGLEVNASHPLHFNHSPHLVNVPLLFKSCGAVLILHKGVSRMHITMLI
jgi:hypothetical protein